MPAFFALFSALFFGASDYLGGRLSREVDSARVTAHSQIFVCALYIALALIVPGEFSARALALGFIGGLASVFGLNLFYSALAKGVVGVVASATALLTAGMPVLWSLVIKGERVTPLFAVGATFAALAIIALALPARKDDCAETEGDAPSEGPDEAYVSTVLPARAMRGSVWLRTICGGVIMSGSLIALSYTQSASGCWPLIGVGGAAVLSGVTVAYLKTGGVFVQRAHSKQLLLMVATMGVAYVAQLYAARSGALAIASVIGALYPIPTMLLARGIDHEKMSARQTLGAVLALLAVAIIALS